MKLPSHVLTMLYLAGAVGTAGVVATCEPTRTTGPDPIVRVIEADPMPIVEFTNPPPKPIVNPHIKISADACPLCGKG